MSIRRLVPGILLFFIGHDATAAPWYQQREEVTFRRGEVLELADLLISGEQQNEINVRLPLPDGMISDGLVTRAEVIAFAGQGGVSLGNVRGAAQTRLLSLAPVSGEQLMRQALEFLEQDKRLASNVVLSRRRGVQDGTVWLPEDVTIERDVAFFDDSAGRAVIRTEARYEGEPWKTLMHAFVWQPSTRPVAARPIGVGERITQLNTASGDVGISGRLVAVLPIAEGEVIDENNTREEMAVERGMTVTVYVRRGAVELQLMAKALSGAGVGQRVSLLSPDLDATFDAIVSSAGEAHVPY